ncbi:MAG: gamma-glutamyl-phosphate reductase, partial [Candidatus Puniceispirillaceae bacterium]
MDARLTDQAADMAMATLTDQARQACRQMYQSSHDQRNAALLHTAHLIETSSDALLAANLKDIVAGTEGGLTKAFIDRLTLTPERIKDIARGLRVIAELDDPVGVEMARWSQPNGLDISRVSTPLGVLGVIFESR